MDEGVRPVLPESQGAPRTTICAVKTIDGENLFIYLVVSQYAISSVLIQEEGKRQHPVYYISKTLLDAETRYPDMEKLALSLITASRKLRPYFYAHTVVVLTNYPLKQVLQKPNTSRCLLKWVVELGKFEVDYKPRAVMKGQALADFIAEFTYDIAPAKGEATKDLDLGSEWTLYVAGSSNKQRFSAGIVLVTPEGHRVHSALRFKFKASNNEAEYEALIAGVKLALEMRARSLQKKGMQ